ncbi:PREDICTED: uncharacterized protein LOC107880139 [Prunus mume]|uniref:Uncharacterized protein LOC107880139 n=1 Tax=Prunus mume TaxID=102107 RepID=A0ABM1LYL8_PRUMU|nr:PREDICTED: uncharacterized protein LOC107880139 [Prunus mume]
MALLFKLKSLRLGYSILSSTFASKTKRFVVGDRKPSNFSLQNQLLCRHFTSEISANQHNFTVTYLINSCGLSPKAAISASKKVELQTPERADSVLALVRNHGLSEAQLSKFVRLHPEVLLADPEQTLLPKLRSLIPEKKVVSVLKNSSWFFFEGHSKNVVPNIGLLRQLGMPQSCIYLLLAHYINVLMVKHERFGVVVGKVKEMGFNLEKATSVSALRVLCGRHKSVWNRSWELYRSWGWSDDDILSAFRRYPQCMIHSEKKVMEVMDLLVNNMGWPSRKIAQYPVVLSLSLKRRLIPRCSVVKVLFLKGVMDENLHLGSVLLPVEKHFLEKFVTAYLKEIPQLLNVYQGKVEFQDL